MSYVFLGYEFDPYYAADFLEHLWQTEPVGTFSILLSLTAILLTFCYKLLDIWWDLRKEKSRQGRLRIELFTEIREGRPGLRAVVSNVGKEPMVVRDFGYFRKGLLRIEFEPMRPDALNPMPRTLNARELAEFYFPATHPRLAEIKHGFCVRDSMGKIWQAPACEVKRARRQLRHLAAELQPEPAC